MKQLKHPPIWHRTYQIVVCSGLLTFASASLSSDVLNASQTICIHGSTQEERRVELVYEKLESPVPCALFYDKDGVRTDVASAKNSKGHCEKVERKMVRNLVSSGFECKHSFLGDLGAQEKSAIELNLFPNEKRVQRTSRKDVESSNAAVTSDLSKGSSSEPSLSISPAQKKPSVTSGASATQIANELKAKLEQEYLSDLQERLEQEFTNALSDDYIVDVTVQLNLEVNITPTGNTSIATEMPQDSIDVNPIELTRVPDELGIVDETIRNDSYTVASKSFDNEMDAHRFAAEFHGRYPLVTSRVGQFDAENDWRLILGIGDDETLLQEGFSQLDSKTQTYFEVLQVQDALTKDNALLWVPDDWARYAVAGCYAKGNTTSIELAQCAGVVVDVDSFLSCLAGGICLPERFSADLSPEQIDFLELVGSSDPAAAARGILLNNIQGCENLREPGSKEAAECVALSILDEDQRQMYDCYQNTGENIDLIHCVGNEELSDSLLLYERCAIDSITLSECVLAEIDNEHLNNAARCVNYGDTEAVLSCAINANLDADESRVLSCITDSNIRTDQAQCLSREYLDEEQTALLNCTSSNRNESNFGLCVANEQGILSENEYRAAECLLAGESDPNSLLNCAGARFASNELNQCMSKNIPLSECFTTETLLNEVVANQVEDLIDLQVLDQQIALFRAEKYALEGGDLPTILATTASAKLFAMTTAVVKNVKKTGGGLLKKFGFGK